MKGTSAIAVDSVAIEKATLLAAIRNWLKVF
jgi:hypothetical protein